MTDPLLQQNPVLAQLDLSRHAGAIVSSDDASDPRWTLHADRLNVLDSYNLLNAIVVPRPIGWASTVSADGKLNLAPYSFFTVVSRMPMMLSLTVGPRRKDLLSPKDTLVNARETGEFVVNIASANLAGAMDISAVEVEPDIDEFANAGLTAVPSVHVRAPRVAEAPINIECTVHAILPMGDYDHLLIGRVRAVHIRADLYEPYGHIDHLAMAPIGRLAGAYSTVENLFTPPADGAVRMV